MFPGYDGYNEYQKNQEIESIICDFVKILPGVDITPYEGIELH